MSKAWIGLGANLINAWLQGNQQRAATDLQYRNFYEQKRLAREREAAAKATRTDAYGNKLVYRPGLGFKTELTPIAAAIMNAQQKEQLAQFRQDAPRMRAAAERQDARERAIGEVFDEQLNRYRYGRRKTQAEYEADAVREASATPIGSSPLVDALVKQALRTDTLESAARRIRRPPAPTLADARARGAQRFFTETRANDATALNALSQLRSGGGGSVAGPRLNFNNPARELAARQESAVANLINAKSIPGYAPLPSGTNNLAPVVNSIGEVLSSYLWDADDYLHGVRPRKDPRRKGRKGKKGRKGSNKENSDLLAEARANAQAAFGSSSTGGSEDGSSSSSVLNAASEAASSVYNTVIDAANSAYNYLIPETSTATTSGVGIPTRRPSEEERSQDSDGAVTSYIKGLLSGENKLPSIPWYAAFGLGKLGGVPRSTTSTVAKTLALPEPRSTGPKPGLKEFLQALNRAEKGRPKVPRTFFVHPSGEITPQSGKNLTQVRGNIARALQQRLEILKLARRIGQTPRLALPAPAIRASTTRQPINFHYSDGPGRLATVVLRHDKPLFVDKSKNITPRLPSLRAGPTQTAILRYLNTVEAMYRANMQRYPTLSRFEGDALKNAIINARREAVKIQGQRLESRGTKVFDARSKAFKEAVKNLNKAMAGKVPGAFTGRTSSFLKNIGRGLPGIGALLLYLEFLKAKSELENEQKRALERVY